MTTNGTLYIIRGLPGSGKSTLARRLVHESHICEADQFFIQEDGNYHFDGKKIGQAHEYCQARVVLNMANPSVGDIVVSNTFTRRWEYQKYIDLAEKYDYSVQVIEVHGPWKNTHGVPDEAIENMKARWEPHIQ